VDGTLGTAAFGPFRAFAALVERCRFNGTVATARQTGLIYATLRGTIDLELGGRAREAKGLGSIEATVVLLLDLLAQP